MKISVVCGSRANNKELLLQFLQSLNNQTFKDFDVNIVCDRKFTEEEEKKFIDYFNHCGLDVVNRTCFFTNNNSDFDPHHAWWASFVRNFWINKAQWDFIQLFDDDNTINPEFLEDCLNKWETFTHINNCDCVILPTLYYRNSNQIQNQWFSHFNYRQSRPVLHLLKWKSQWQVEMFSGNGIFGKASTLKKAKYDEQIARISEDLDYTLSLHEQWVQLWVFSDLKVLHHERDKNKLEQAWIWSYSQAKQKAKNWFLFTKKHWNKKQLLQFYFCWLPWCVVRLSFKSIIYWWMKWFDIIKWLFSWIREWYALTHEK